MKIFLNENVFDKALERLNFLFDEFDQIIVSFSGGKDSTLTMEMALKVAEERNRLPLKVMFLDQEAEWQNVIDYVRDVMTDPRIEPMWFQVPIKMTNSTSNEQHYLHCWTEGDDENWMRPKEDFAITPVQRLAKRQNKMIKRLVKWTGRLNKTQVAMIAEWAKTLPVDKEVRVSRQSGFMTMISKQLKDRSNPEQFKRNILTQIKTPERFSSPVYKQSYAKRKQLTQKLISDLFNSLTPTQKSTLIASVKKYQADFLYLAPRA